MNPTPKSVEERLDDLERKMDHIISVLGINSLRPKAGPTPEILPRSRPSSHLTNSLKSPSASKGESAPDSSSSLNLLPLLALICFFLAAVFIVKLTIESGWLTPERQWGGLTFFGIALVGFSLFFEKIETSYRSYAGAAGIVVLYVAAYSSFLYFGLFSPIISMVLGASVSLLCFYLFSYFKSELFVVICTIGTYISPILLNKETDLIYLSAFFLIWASIFSRIAIAFKTRTLTLLASYMGIGIFAFLNLGAVTPENALNIIFVQGMQFSIYAGGVFLYSVKNQDYLTKTEATAYLPVLLFFYGTIYYFLNIFDSQIAPWISLGFAGFIYLLYSLAKKANPSLQSESLVQSFFSVVLFHSGYMQIVPMEGKPWLLPLIILGIYISEQRGKHHQLSYPLRVMFSTIAVFEFFQLCFRLIGNADLLNVVPAFFTVVLGAVYYLRGAKSVKNQEGLFLSLLHIISILSLYRLAFDYGSLAVTCAWGIYSVVILIFGYLKKHATLAKSSLIVLMITSLKALVYDASQASSISRIGSLLLTGAILYGAGYMFQKINKWTEVKSEDVSPLK